MTTQEASQVGVLSLGKGRFDLLIMEMRTPPSAAHVVWEVTTWMAVDSSLCSWFECVVGLSLCSTQFSLVVS